MRERMTCVGGITLTRQGHHVSITSTTTPTTKAPQTHSVGALSRCHPGHRGTRVRRYVEKAVGGSTLTAHTRAPCAHDHGGAPMTGVAVGESICSETRGMSW